MDPQSDLGAPGASAAATPSAMPSVPSWPWSRRARNAGVHLFWALWWALMAAWPTRVVADHSILRVLAVPLAATYLVRAVGEFRVRVLLEPGGLVITKAVRRTRIPWTDVSEVRVRGLRMGPGWVEVVRGNSREVVLPTPVEAYPLLKGQWERSAATSRAPGIERDATSPTGDAQA